MRKTTKTNVENNQYKLTNKNSKTTIITEASKKTKVLQMLHAYQILSILISIKFELIQLVIWNNLQSHRRHISPTVTHIST